jgi:hypothetical protein
VAPSNVFEANAEETQAITTAQESQGGSLKNDNTSVDDWYRAMSNQIDIQMGQVEQNLESQINSHVRALHARALILAWTVGLLIVLLALLFSVILRPSIRQLPAKVRPVRQSGARHRGAVERGDQRSRLSRELEDLGSEHHEGAPRRAGGPYT